jgi:hypothetical protein
MEEGTSIVFQLTSFCVALYHNFKYEQIVDLVAHHAQFLFILHLLENPSSLFVFKIPRL